MSQERVQVRERALDLVIARATIGLSPAEAEELLELREQQDVIDSGEPADLERAIDATRRAVMGGSGGLPIELRERVIRAIPIQSERMGRGGMSDTIPIERARNVQTRTNWWPAVAAAAIVLIGSVVVWSTLPQGRAGGVVGGAGLVARVDSSADRVTVAFKPGEGALAGATGEVVWSDTLQRGYMRIKGAKPNDAAAMQYQLWIVDPARDKNPVDGGVFDIAASASADGAVVVPFESRLAVNGPKVFAITAEKPGGVVVSAGPLIMVAAR